MNFNDDTNRNLLNINELYAASASALESRLVFLIPPKQELQNENKENWENPDIEALLDMRALRLLTKQEVIDKLNAMKRYYEGRLAVITGSRSNMSDFVNGMIEGGEVEKKLSNVMENLNSIQAKMYEEEASADYDKYKTNFDKLVKDILVAKANLEMARFKEFIDKSPPYLERISSKLSGKGNAETRELIAEAIKIKGGKSKKEVRDNLTWLSGTENDMSPIEYKTWNDDIQTKAKTQLEKWLSGKVDDTKFSTDFSQLMNAARAKGGEKAALQLLVLEHEYKLRRVRYEATELNYVHTMFGEKGEDVNNSSGMLFVELRNIKQKVRYGEYTDSEAASELWRRLAFMVEKSSSYVDFSLENGEFKNVQDFLGRLRSKYDSGGIDFMGMMSECFAYRDGLPVKEDQHRKDLELYQGLLKGAKQDYSKVTHDAVVYGFIYKDLTEKDSARKAFAKMKGTMDETMKDVKRSFESGDMTKMQDAAYTLDQASEFLAVMASVDLSQGPAAPRRFPENKSTLPDNLLGAFDAFSGHETTVDDAIAELQKLNPEIAGKIKERISQVNNDVRFVDRESFDEFFDGKKQDNFQGLPGAFYYGTIYLVYPFDIDGGVERLYKILTHESIHHTMHAETSDETGRFLNTLLYGDAAFSEDGLNKALTGNTIGAQIINQFMIDKGDEFEDWVQKRTKIGDVKKDNGKLTFEEVIKYEDVSKEILEEAITVYLTYYSLHGRQLEMKPPYLDYLRKFHEKTEGKEIFSRFMPSSNGEQVASLGADEENESGVSASSGGGKESKEKDENKPAKNLEDLLAYIQAVEGGTIVQIENFLQELYGLNDYDGVLESSKDDLNHLKSEIQRYALEEQENGDETPEDARRLIEKNIDAIKKNLEKNMLEKLDGEKALRAKNPIDKLSFASRLWKDTKFVSLDDVIKVFQDGWAYLKERRELRRDNIAAQIGQSIAPTTRMSNYFEGLVQSVQNRDIAKWKEIYTDKDPNSLNAILDNADDINQVKALFEIKADSYGDFFFRSEQTKKALEAVSGKQVDTYHQAKAIFDDLYGRGEADGLERKNASSRKGKVSESAEMGKSHADSLGLEWMNMVRAMQEEPPKWVDSAKFEGFIQYALTAGKSYLRQVIWMIAKGFSLGILDYKTIVEMGGSALIKNAPHIEYLGEIIRNHERGIIYKDDKTEIEYIASLDLFTDGGAETRGAQSATGDQLNDWVKYEKWLLYEADKSERVKQRHGKIKSSTDGVDHDYIQDMWWEFNKSAYVSILNEKTGAVQFVQDEGIANIYGQFITNSLYWTDDDMMKKYESWFKTDRLLVEENFDNNGQGFDVKQNLKQKSTNKTILDDSKLEGVTGAVYNGIKMKHFRNLAYYAWKESKGNMQIARDIMMAGALKLKIGHVPKASIKLYYEQNESKGWSFSNVETQMAKFDPTKIPEAPQSHFYSYKGTSMVEDLHGYPPGFK